MNKRNDKQQNYVLRGRQHEYSATLVDEIPTPQRGRARQALTVTEQIKYALEQEPGKILCIDITDHPGTSGLGTTLKRKGFDATTRRLDNRTFLYVKS